MAANLARLLECNIRCNNAAAVQNSLRLFSNQWQQQTEVEDDEGSQRK